MEAAEPIIQETPSSEDDEKFKSESNYKINSNKNNLFNITIKNLTSSIEINAFYQDEIKLNEYEEKYRFKKLKEIKFLSICDSIDEIYDELLFELSKNNTQILENENQISIIIPVVHAIYKEITLCLNKKIKSDKEINQDLYKIVIELKKEMKEKEKKINECINKIEELNEINQNMENRMNKLEQEILDLKKNILNKKVEQDRKDDYPEDKINLVKEVPSIIKNLEGFEEIENPWTKELEKVNRDFDYILKEGNYYAEKHKKAIDTMYLKSAHKFEKNRIYKLIYEIAYINNRFRVGFGDFGVCNSRLKEKGSVGLTETGLYIDGEKVNNSKIEKYNKKVVFIIDFNENQKSFELFLDEKSLGKFNFNLNNIYALAVVNNGSVRIKTLRNI